MQSINPATGEILADYPDHDATEVARRLGAAGAAFPIWRRTAFAGRAVLLRRVAAGMRGQKDALARLMTLEMGKPIAQSESEVEKCAWVCEHYADHGERYLASEIIACDASLSFVRFDPLGVILAVMPWNFQLWQVFRCAAPTLMAGNVLVLKHASNVPGCALAIERLFLEAGLPPGAFTTLLVSSAAVPALIEHPVVQAVSLTGSESAGVAVAARAGAAIKKTVLELGGSDAFIVLADADPVATADAATAARVINNGQSCIAAKRFIVEAGIAVAFEEALVRRIRSLVVGEPLDRRTELGPLARADLRDQLHDQVERSCASGAQLATGGRALDQPGFYYEPTVLTAVEPGMPAFDEETFGPLAAVTRARDASHAVELANASRFALGASVWTADPRRAEPLVSQIEAGAVFVNGPVKSDPRLPFGGLKRSGYGRELSAAGMREFVNMKTVWIK